MKTKICALILLAMAGCSDDEATSPGAGPQTPGGSTPGGPGTAPAEAAAPLFVGSTRIFSGDTSQGYLFTVPSLDAGTPVDLGKAVEITDAWVFGDAKPYFFTATIFEPTITRWSLREDGSFEQGPAVSFANHGVTGAYSTAFVPLWSKTKSFFVDSGSAQVIVWNPEDVSVIGTIPVDTTRPAGLVGPPDLESTIEIAVRPDKIFVTVFWNSGSSGWTELGNLVRVITIDPNTNAILSTTEDTRCGSASPAGTAADGTTYFAPWDYHAAVRGVFGGTKGVRSCGLRIVPGGASMDAAYDVDLSTLVGGKPAGSAFLASDTELLLHVWNNDLVGATPANWVDDKRFGSGYTWYRWTIGSPAATEVTGQVPLGEGGTWQRIGEKLYTYGSNADFSKTTLQELDASGALVPRIEVPGYSNAVIRAR